MDPDKKDLDSNIGGTNLPVSTSAPEKGPIAEVRQQHVQEGQTNPEIDTTLTGTTQQQPAAPPPLNPPALPASNNAGNPATPVTQDDNTSLQVPSIADDNDLIEKEWVEKAKELVNQTRDDPHNQNKVLNKFKATYIKKRYNKDIPVDKE